MQDTIWSILCETTSQYPEGTALITPEGVRVSYRDFKDLVSKISLSLVSEGVKPGDRIAMVLPNGPEMAAVFFGVTAVATCAPINPSYSEEEFSFFLSDLGCSGMVVLKGHQTLAAQAARKLHIPCYEICSLAEILSDKTPFAGLSCKKEELIQFLSSPDDIALILHTSGTTAKPKLVPLHQDSIAHNAKTIAKSLDLNRNDTCLNLMPLFHVHGLVGCLLSTMASGGAIITTPGLDQSKLHHWLSDLRPTWYSAVPAIHHAIIQSLEINQVPEHTLRFIRSCSSPLPPSLGETLENLFAVSVIEAYGMTEAAHQIASNPSYPGGRKFGSVGVPTGYQVRIRDENQNDLVSGDPGEVWISGKNLFSGYENNPAANKESIINGFFRTGDVGFLDSDGYLFLTGRSKEIINKGGEKIAPREIEEILLSHPDVDQVVVCAIPHPALGEDIGAMVVPVTGRDPSPEGLREFLSSHLISWKIPSRIRIVWEIPKGPTGKVKRNEISKLLMDNQESARDSPENSELSKSEKIVMDIWSSVFQNGVIRLDDDFFSLGGYSLMAMAITTEIERQTGCLLPPTALFEAPTIRKLSSLVDKKSQGNEISNMVPFNTKGDRLPLFLVPPGRGNAFYYKDLAANLGSDQPFYSFSWVPSSRSWSSFEELADIYIRELLQVYPDGPLVLGGYCIGAVVALEMAHQLARYNREVRCLLLIDPEILKNGPGWNIDTIRETKREQLIRFLREGPRHWHHCMFQPIRDRKRRQKITREERMDMDERRYRIHALNRYVASHYPGKSIIFFQDKRLYKKIPEQWMTITGEGRISFTIPDTKHHEVLNKGMEKIGQAILEITGNTRSESCETHTGKG